MGARINYYESISGKGLKDTIFVHFDAFSLWLLASSSDSNATFDEPFGYESAARYLAQRPDLKSDFESLDKKLVDELTSAFMEYSDGREGILKFLMPNLNGWRYTESTEKVIKSNDNDLIRLWKFMITEGRSLCENEAYGAWNTDDFKYGFLTREERQILRTKIQTYFGEQPKPEGFQYVLMALDNVSDEKDLIIGIE